VTITDVAAQQSNLAPYILTVGYIKEAAHVQNILVMDKQVIMEVKTCDIPFVFMSAFFLFTIPMNVQICAVEPPNKGHFGTSCFVPCREVVPFSEVKDVLIPWERVPEQRPLLGGCPLLGGSFIRGSTILFM